MVTHGILVRSFAILPIEFRKFLRNLKKLILGVEGPVIYTQGEVNKETGKNIF